MYSKDFRLEDSLSAYISQVKQAAPLSQSDEAELRAHLCDSSEDLQKCGLSAEEAFMIAAKRLGHAGQVGEEYKKVTTGVVTDKIWAYMLVGFSLIGSLLWLYRIIGGNLQVYLVRHFADEPFWIYTIIGCFNLSACAGIWSVLLWGKSFSAWVQRIIQKRPWTVALIMLVMVGGVVFLEPVIRQLNPVLLNPQHFTKDFPRATITNKFVEFSIGLTLISACFVILLSVFSISNVSRLSLKNLFVAPSYIFLFIFGAAIEIVAALFRIFNGVHMLFTVLLFSLVYVAGSFLISYYNRLRTALYLCIFASFGFTSETWAGLIADAERGTYYTVYYVGALIMGVIVGSILGRRWPDQLHFRRNGAV